jgi:hypothetical protein
MPSHGWQQGPHPACRPSVVREWSLSRRLPDERPAASRFNRTRADERAYIRRFDSSAERAAALPGWLHLDNHHRDHTPLAGTPMNRTTVNNLGQF